jgi:hypothetical protein
MLWNAQVCLSKGRSRIKPAEREKQLLEAAELLAAAEQLAGIGSWMMHPDTGELIWSRNMFRIWGVDPEAGVPSDAQRTALTHPDDRERRVREIERVSGCAGAPGRRTSIFGSSTRMAQSGTCTRRFW